jgi:hypothetical protein
MNNSYLRILVVLIAFISGLINSIQSQCYTPPAYCTSISATNVGSYGMGIQNVTLNTAAIPAQINNTTSPGSGSPIYFDYTSQILTAASGAVVNYSIRGGTSNQTKIRLFIDFDNNGTFNTTPIATAGGELVLDLANMTVANTTVSGTFTLPTLSAGSYRIRVASDGQGNIPPPCGPSFYSADYEDYTLMVASGTADALVTGILQPTVLNASPAINPVSFTVRNLTNATMTSISAGYMVNGGTATTQTFTGLSIASGASYTVTFSTGFTAPTLGNYALKYFLYNVNGTTTQNTPLNDTICQTIPLLCTGPLTGSYTIDPAGGFTTTNFQSFTNAVNALRACGVSGPVSFSVAAGTYTDTLYIPNITGVSAINTITFDGGNGNKATRILTYPTSSSANAVVRFNSSRFVTVRNMTLRSTGAAQGWVVHFMHDSSDRVNNCNIEFTGAATSSSSSSFIAVVLNNSLTSYTTQSNICRRNIVDSNSINWGWIGISSCASLNTATNYFLSNTISNSYQYGVYVEGNQVAKCNYNNIVPRSTTAGTSGIYFINSNVASTHFHEVLGNKIDNAGQYGVYATSSAGQAAASNICANNMITGFRNTSGYGGIFLNSSSRWKLYHNSINCNLIATSGTTAGIYNANSSFTDCRNNNIGISATSGTSMFPVWANTTGLFTFLDYNNYFNASSPNLLQINSVNLTASNYKTASPANGGANSYNDNPAFVSSTNLHTTQPCFNGATGLGITTDYDGETRAGTPDMGADELTAVPNNDIQVMSITTPVFPLVAGSQPVTVVIRNLGNNVVSSFDVNYRLNNGTVVSEPYAGAPISPCATVVFNFATTVTIGSGTSNFKAYTTSPNGSSDAVPSNDTAQWTLCNAMNGTYTINPLGSGSTNFTSFTTAIAALNCGGVNGAVTFNVSNGTYAEQLFLAPIMGASAANTIKFQSLSGVAANCIISFSTPSSQAIIDLNGADFITFDKFTIRNTFTSTGFGVWIRNGADFNTISNCIIDMAASGVNGYGVYQTNTIDNRNTINGNTINGAGYGVFLNANSSSYSNRNVISNNSINGSYYYGMYFQYQDSVIISGNTITSSSANSSYYGIYAYWLQKGPIIAKNKIVFTSTYAGSNSFYGMYLDYFNINSSNPTRGLIANNMIQVGGGFATAYGIYTQNSCNYSDIIHNSVNMTTTAANGSYALLMNTSFSFDTIRNNIFQNIGNGTTSGYAASIRSGTNMFYNNNDFYTRNSNFALYNGSSYANYAAWKAAAAGGIPGFEAAGVSREVTFTSSTDLHTTLPCIADIGYNYTSTSPSINKVLDDYDGQTRSTTPDLGCDEFTTAPFDVATQLMTSPTGSVFALATPYTIRTVVRNNGSTTITALDMSYSVNGGAATSQSFTGLSLLPCDTITLTFTSPLTLTASGSNALKIFNGLINTSNADGNNTNDTLIANLCTSYSGTYSINKNLPFSASNFTSVSQAVNSLYSCGMSGPVVLRIDAGSGPYNEQVTFNGMIPGLNRTNNLRISGNTTRETITFNPTVATLQHTIRLITVKHITLDSLTINNTGASFGVGVHLVTTADSNFVKNSNINISLASASLSNSAGIAISTNTASVTTAGNNGNNNVFDNNTITGGYYGISAMGTSTTVFCKRNDVTNNRLFGQAFYGIYWYNQDSTKINGNTIDNMLSSNVNSFGMDLRYTERFELKKNKINRTGQYGIFLSNTNFQNGTGTVRSEISNNMIGGTFYNLNPIGLYTQTQFRNIDFWHNTIHVVNQGNGNAFNMNQTSATSHTGLDFRNNTFTATNNSAPVGYFYYNSGSIPFSNFLNNNIWGSNSSASQAFFSCSNYNTNGWILANVSSCISGLNTLSCRNLDPQFINGLTDLHSIQSPLSNWGTNIGAVTSDIDGDTRPLSPSSTVDVGADEYNIPALNIGAASVVTPVAPMTLGTQDVIIQIKNHGAATVTSANVSYKVGVNGSVKTVAWTGSIANNATANITFTGSNQYNFTGAFDTVIAWTDAPNGGVDGFIFNDTFVNNVVCQSLAGTYTLDPGLPASTNNFVNFSSLASRLNNCGITGPVTINVAAGTYTEQFELKQYPGVSAVNTVTIKSASGIASSVNLQFNTATVAANNYVVYMNGADYTRFQNMTMTNSNTGIGSYIIWQLNNSRFNTFQNIIFNGANTSSTSQQYSIIYANNANAGQLNQGDDNNTINQCTFNNGSYGIYYNGSYSPYYTYNTTITNNTFSQQSAYATYLNFHINFNFSGNTITTSTANDFYGLYVSNGGVQANSASQFTTISKNNINIANNGTGMYLNYVNGTNTSPIIYPLVSNNFIKIGSGTGTAYALFSSYSHARYYHNTFNVTSGSTTTPAVYLQYGCCYSPLQEFKFNIVANSGNGTNAGRCIFSDMNTASQVKIDSNVYFQGTGAGSFGNYNGALQATFANWKTAMGVTFDAASLVTNPNFVSSTNLRINSGTNLRAVPVHPLVPDDIDNLNRCGITDVGADHHPSGLDAGVSAITSPANGVASPGLQDVKVLLTNIGSTTLTSANVSYNINGTVQTKAWTGSLATCAFDTIVFTGAQQYNFTGSFTMKAFSNAPNGGADPNATNDTAYSSGCVGMGGVYTIGGTAGPTNFTTFGAAITAMQACGIGSPITFQVASGTYTEQLSIPVITGASTTNTITFDGGNGNAATRILSFATGASSSGLSHVLRFNNCSNVFFRNMTIRSSGASEAWTVHFMNGVNNRLNNCIVEMTGTGATSNSTNFTSVVINGSTTSLGTLSTIANNHRIDSSTIRHGYYSVYTNLNNGNNTLNFTYNNFVDAYQYGIFCQNAQTIKFNNNTVNTRNSISSTIPVYLSSANPSGLNYHEFIGNSILRTGQYGLYFTSTNGGASNQGLVYNNMINGFTYTSGTSGIFVQSSSNWNVYHNTVNMDLITTSGTNAGLNVQSGSNNNLRNNILATNKPTAFGFIPLIISTGSTVASLNDNNYFNPSSVNLVQIFGVNYTASNYTNAYPAGGGLNSINVNPSFVSATDIHVTNPCNNGANLGILTDFEGHARGSAPDMGADEMSTVANNDLGVTLINSPNFPLVSGSQSINVTLKNFGANTITSANINYTVNGGTVVSQAWAGSLAPCATVSLTLTNPFTFGAGTSNLKVYTTSPNGVSDIAPSNDTTQWTLCPALNGTYTINPSGSGPTNFTTFTAAVNNLICGGVSGPVTFNVSNGTYNEQIQIPSIIGASATNTIRFQSATSNATACILTFTPSSSGSYTLYLNGADFITFDRMTIANGYTASTVYTTWIGGSANFNTFSNCIINNPVNPDAFAVYQNGSTDNFNTWMNDTINNGGYGIYLQSNTSKYSNRNTISNCFLNNQTSTGTAYGIYVYYHDSTLITGNLITTNQTSGTYFGILTQTLSSRPIVTKNRIYGINLAGPSAAYGMQHNSFASSGVGRGLIANNFISMGGTATTNIGLQMQSSSNNTDVMHNSINMTSTVLSANVVPFFYSTSLSGNTVRNNIFQASGDGMTSCAVANIGTSGTSSTVFNNNNYFSRNATTFGYSGTSNGNPTASFAAFRTGGAAIASFETSGLNREVTFVSNSDLHTSTACMKNAGSNVLSTLPDDIDGDTRTATPDLGADQFVAIAFDNVSQAIVSPNLGSYALATPYTVRVRVRNNGSTTITALAMNYSLNGGAATSQSFTGLNLLPCDTTTLTFTATLTLTASGSNVLRVFNGLINTSNADGNNTNDTVSLNLCTPYSGTLTINKNLPLSSSNFTSVSQAVNSLYSCGMSGPVVLRIDAGSGPYNEQVTFNGMITGLTRVNNLRISGNTTRETITFNPTVSNLQHTIRLITVKHITLDSLTINNTGANFGVGVHLVTTADSNFVTNSNINLSLASTSFSNSAGIAISSNTSSPTGTGNSGNGNKIMNNTITGGYYGISTVGTNTTTFCRNNDIINNTITGQAYYGVYSQFQDSTKINQNTIRNLLVTNTIGIGIWCQYIERFEINRNNVNYVGQSGFDLSFMNFQNGTGTDRSSIVNNMIGGFFYNNSATGINLQSRARNIDINHNSISMGNNTSGGAFSISYSSSGTYGGLVFRNNSLVSYNSLSSVGNFYWNNSGLTPAVPFTAFENNNIFNANPSATGSTTISSFGQNGFSGTSWIGASINGLNTSSSISVNPFYLNSLNDLHTLNTALSNKGTNAANVNIDIDGQARPLSPDVIVDIGADEYNVPADNSGVTAVISPSAPLTPGLQNVVVQIRNYGSTTLTSANVRYKVGVNGTTRSIAWTGSVATNATTNVTFTGANQHNFTGSFDTIIAWTDAPNGQPDGFIANDTAVSITCSPLSGTYTIDTTLATGSGNFNSWASALTNLMNCGVSGPVTINVTQPGTYAGAIDIMGINGSSSVNTVTFNGVNSVNRILVATTSSAAPAVLRFNNCNFVTFRNFTIRTLGANDGWCAHFFNGLNNRVTNCILDIGGAGTASASSNLIPVVMNGNYTNSGTASTTGNNHSVDSSTLNAGYYSVYTSNSTGTNTYRFLNNTMNNAYQYGAYFNSSHAIKFNNNIVNMRGINGGTYGLYIINNNPSSPNFHEINGNKFTNIGQYGIYFATSSNSGSTMGQVFNNMISGFKSTSTNVGIYNSSSSRWNIWHNSINLDFASTSGTNNCIYLQNGGTIDLRNNILSVTSPTIVNATPLFISPSSAASALNNNLYYNASSANLIGGAINSTTSNYKLAFPSGGGLGSVNADPRFVNNATDLHTLNGCYTGANLGVTVDIDNQTRGTAPDIGADETGPVVNNDMGIVSLNSPAFPLVAGSTNVNVTLRNFGANTVSSVTVSYRVNGGTLTSQTLTGLSLSPCDTLNFTFSTPFVVTGSTNLSVFTSNPNGVTDVYLNNDTTNLSLCVAMSGSYSIGPSGDFTTFTQAVSQLNCAGVNGPVIFNVLSNTFAEQVSIGVIQGASASNTITFDGGVGNASSRILTFAASAENPHTFRLNGTEFVNIRNLTIRSTDGTNGWPVSIVEAKNCIVSNCNIEVAGAGATATGSNLAAVVINGSRTSMGTGSSEIHNVYIDSNKIRGGFHGIYVNGNLVNTNYAYTRDNIIDSAYQNGIFSNNMTHKCNNNRIIMRVLGGPSNSAGISIPSNYTQTPDFSTYNYNQIYNARQYGIFISGSFYSNAGINQQVNNNVIGQFLGTGVTYGIFSGFSTNNEYYHNTININNAATGASRAMQINNSSSIFVRNNIFAITNASAASTSIPIQFTNSGSTTVSNNCYFNAASTNIIQTTSGTFTTAAITTAFPSGGGAGSITTDPQFPAAGNLRLGAAVAGATFNSTVSIASLPYDMDNNPRNPPLGTTTPDMGAYDKTTSNVGVSAVISPTAVTAGNTHSITVRIRNYGTDAVSNIPVNYSLNGGTAVTETYVPTLNGNDSVSYTFATTATFAGCNSIRCYTSLAGESFPANDTASRNIGANIAGVYTINPSGAGATNFTTFANAIAFLNCGMVTGPVTFQVAAATYNEQVVIPSTIVGVTATNTITFDGGSGNAATRILTFATGASGSGLSHVLRFNNCSFITFRNMTIRSSGISEAWTVHFMNGTNNRLNSCIVDMTGNGTTSTSTNFTSVVINGSTTSRTTNSTAANNHRVDSCTINFGYYGIFTAINNGALTNFFTNNNFANTYFSGGWFQNAQTVKFNNNTINTRSTMTTAQPIYFTSANPSGLNFHEVNGNTIVRTGQYGIFFTSTQGGPSTQGQCYNNFINGMTSTSSTTGIYLSSASNWNLYHNTVNHDINSTTGSSFGIQILNGSNNDVRNNILSTTIPTTVSWTPFLINPSSAVSAVNSNNYWNPSSSNLVTIGGVNYTAANFNVAYPSGGGLNSINKNPFYVSASNIHVTSVCNNGENLGVLVDIDGQTRAGIPDMGADEVTTVFTVSYTSTPVFSTTGGGVDTIVVTSGDTVVLSGTGANSYSWSGPQLITNAVSFVATSAGEYTVTGTTSGCTNTKKVYVKLGSALVTATTAQNGVKLTRRGVIGSFIYYGDGVNYYFAIDTSGITSGSLTGDTVIISVQTTIDSSKSSNGRNQEHAMYLMPRFWNAMGSFTGTVKVRFPYLPSDTALLVSLRDSAWSRLKNVTNINTRAVKTPYLEWFKTVGRPYNASYISGIVGNKFPFTKAKPTVTYGVTGGGVHYVELGGITSFSGGSAGVGFGPGGGGGGVSLPATWAGFDVQTLESGNELTWKTASEKNTNYFEVEYSYDAKDFQVASHKIQAAGNSASLSYYNFNHSDFNSFVYYRIKQVDLDGQFDYSEIKLAKRAKGKEFQVSVYPTKILENGRITIEAKNIDKSQISLSIMDVSGKVIYTNSYNPSNDSLREEIELYLLSSGVYFIEISNGQGRDVVKVLR